MPPLFTFPYMYDVVISHTSVFRSFYSKPTCWLNGTSIWIQCEIYQRCRLTAFSHAQAKSLLNVHMKQYFLFERWIILSVQPLTKYRSNAAAWYLLRV